MDCEISFWNTSMGSKLGFKKKKENTEQYLFKQEF